MCQWNFPAIIACLLSGIKGVINISYDSLVFGDADEEHENSNLEV